MQPAIFLWGGRFPEPFGGSEVADGEWWRQYSEKLAISPDALAELSESSRRLVSLLPKPSGALGYPAPVRGAVVGSVQSGKTAHMLAVTARALDCGYMVVVVLAGLKDDLRAQTARRFNVQLLRQRDPVSGNRSAHTLSLSASQKRVEAVAPPYFLDCHQWPLFHIRMTQAIDRGRPVVAVIKKNQASLANMRERIQQGWSRLGQAKLPVLVLDDECDEASVEEEETPTPELIANLWRPSEGALAATVSYVGYTATVAANLLQKPDNELYPADFVYLLRSPAAQDSPLTFREPSPHAWYCGGETFYERFIRPVDGGSSLLVDTCVTEDELAHGPAHNGSLKQAVRTYLLGAALRALEHPEVSLEDASNLAEAHTMMVQASTSIADHERWANAISTFLGIDNPESGASVTALEFDHAQSGARWTEALASINQSRSAVNELQPHPWPLRTFDPADVWNQVLKLAAHVRLRVLNSAPGSVDDLDFEPSIDSVGMPIAPRDLLAIIIGGGRLSRGLTIPGLSVSYFARRSEVPAEDTILQLSRWYGYRGRHLDYCRVFTTEAIASELVWINTHDKEMRSRLASLMQRRVTPREAGLVLSSIPRGLPTAKLGIGKLRDISYSPWCRALQFVEIGAFEEHNEAVAVSLVQEITARGGKTVTTGGGTTRGMLSSGWSADDLIRVLNMLQFSRHNPDHGITPFADTYKPSDATRPVKSYLPEEVDPYAIAAYLRKWNEQAKAQGEKLPSFNVGVAYGTESVDGAPFTIPLANREISSEGFVNGGWVGGSAGWPGDQFFDGVPPELLIDDTAKRSEGADGLLLLYILHKDRLGRRNKGAARRHHSPMLAISIPAGGPVFRRVFLPPSKNP